MGTKQNAKTPSVAQLKHRALPEILTEYEQEFVRLCARGVSPFKAAETVYGKGEGRKGRELLEKPSIKHRLRDLYARAQKAEHISRTRVLQGFVRAADMAEQLADPMAMISAYREMGKMCGYYAVETKKVELSVTGEIGIRKITALSDEDLLKLAKGDVIEGEFAQLVGEVGDAALSSELQDIIDVGNDTDDGPNYTENDGD